MKRSADFPRLLEAFFVDRLTRQRRVSPYTIASYRDTFRLLLGFAETRIHKAPSTLHLEDLDAPLIGAFLDHVENERGNSPRSRNVRPAAIRSFFRYAALQEPAHAGLIQRVLAMPNKRFERRPIDFLIRPEIDALLAAPIEAHGQDTAIMSSCSSRSRPGCVAPSWRALRIESLVLARGAHVRCQGKGRKERCTPLRKATVAVLCGWLRERGGISPIRCFPMLEVACSAPTGSNTLSRSTPPPLATAAPP
jgi:site-specific recombinase XerD